ncbi:MAG: sodium:proton antiporter [Methylocystis sp.]|nr:MAG: sodium:proton antiporter [Methylocystis sp.]
MRCFLLRSLVFLGLWLVISGVSTSDLALGLAVAVIAAFASARLLPCTGVRLNPRACVEMALGLPFQIAVAGIEIARRALHPKLPLSPGFIEYTSHLPEGVSRNAFTALVSMQPGSVPIAGHKGGDILIHCLDDTRPVGAAVEADEAKLSRAFGLDRTRG